MKIKEQYKIREVAGEFLVVNQGGFQSDMTKVISLNKSAVKLWEALVGKEFTKDDAAQVLVETYGIDVERARKDAEVWIERLTSCGVI